MLLSHCQFFENLLKYMLDWTREIQSAKRNHQFVKKIDEQHYWYFAL